MPEADKKSAAAPVEAEPAKAAAGQSAPAEPGPSPATTPPPLMEISTKQVFPEDPFAPYSMPVQPHWSVVWADLMMTMFIVFVILYVYAVAQKEFLGAEGLSDYPDLSVDARAMAIPGSGDGEAAGPSAGFIERMFDLSQQAITQEGLRQFASVELVPERTVRIILTGDLLFDSGQAVLRPSALDSLHKITGLLRLTPYAINIIGHTDDLPIATGRFPSNWELSAARASAVARYLADRMAIPENQLSVIGHGSNRPVRPNDTPENRAVNRRVEIIITKEPPGVPET